MRSHVREGTFSLLPHVRLDLVQARTPHRPWPAPGKAKHREGGRDRMIILMILLEAPGQVANILLKDRKEGKMPSAFNATKTQRLRESDRHTVIYIDSQRKETRWSSTPRQTRKDSFPWADKDATLFARPSQAGAPFELWLP